MHKQISYEFMLVEMPAGSRLYGTAGPESDSDYKGVFVPTARQLLLCQTPRQVAESPAKAAGEKNGPGDEERVWFALHEFVRMALEGQTLAMDMLFASPAMWMFSTSAWRELHQNRNRFLNKNLHAFIGYARRQANKYGMKGSRLEAAKWAVAALRQNVERTVRESAGEIVAKAKVDGIQHVSLWDNYGEEQGGGLEILGRYLTPGATCGHYVAGMERYERSYGERAKMAATSEGVDWKAMSHAVRAAIMVENILTRREWELPFDAETAKYLRGIKLGAFQFADVIKDLDSRLDRCTGLSEISDLPEHGDKEWAEDWVFETTKRWIF